MNRFVRKTLFIALFLSSFTVCAQSTEPFKYSYSINITTNNQADEKVNVEFFRQQFSTTKCTFDSNSSNYMLYLDHSIDPTKLKTKIEALGYVVNGSITRKFLNDSGLNQNNSAN